MLKLGELVAYLRADDKQLEAGLADAERKLRRSGKDMERDATSTGQAVGAAIGAGGGTGGERFTRDAAGKLRDARGRFIREGEQLGDGIGRGLGDGASRNTSWLGQVQNAVRSMGGAFGSARDWIQQASSQVSNFVGNVSSVVGSVLAVIQVLAVLAAVAAFAMPAVSLLGGALGALPAIAGGVGVGIGALVLGFMGLTDQFKKHTAAGGAVVDKAWQIASAERRVRDANLEVLAATEALSRARETAAERIDDLSRSIAGAHLDEEGAVLAVADAEKELAQARRSGTADDVKRADLALRQQRQTLDDIRDRLGDMEQDQRRNAEQGVEGSDEVRAAYDRQRRAVEGVADAEHALAEARKPSGGGGGAAADIMAIAPAAAAAVAAIKALKPAWDSLRLDVQQRLFAGVAGEIRSLSDAWLPTLRSKLGNTADSFNSLFKIFSTEVKKPEFIENIGKGLDAVDRLIDKVGGAVAGPFTDAFGRLSAAASPFLDAVGDEIAGLVNDFAKWIKQADESGALKDFFKRAGDFFHDVVDMGKDVGGIIGDIVKALFDDPKNKDGGSTWEKLKKNLDELRQWFDNPDNQSKIQDWFQVLQDVGTVLLWVGAVIGWFILVDDMLIRKIVEVGEAIWKWATKTVPDAFNSVVKWVEALPDRISAATSGMWNGIKESFRSAVNWIIGRWNNLSFTVGGGTILGQPVPSMTLNTPNIPFLADGGVVRATPGGRLVNVAEGGKDEVVAPLDKLAAMLGLGRAGGTTRIVAQSDDDLLSLLFRSIRWKVMSDYGGDLKEAFGGEA